MDIKRKKVTQAEIFETEQKFVTEITEICQDKNEAFRAIGYELVLEFGQKDHEYQKQFDSLSNDADKKFESGYVSRAIITVKRPKTEEDTQENIPMETEEQTPSDCNNRTFITIKRPGMTKPLISEESESYDMPETEDEAPVSAEEDDKRSVAFTRVMLVRAYKSFWTEWISLGGDLEQLKADLDEFFEVLSAGNEEA